MTSKNIKRNVEILKSRGRGATANVKGRVEQVINLYQDRKISQRETAISLINGLMSENKRTVNATIKRLDNKFEGIEARKPLSERIATNRDKTDYSIAFLLYGVLQGGKVAFRDNQGNSHELLKIQQPITISLKKVRDDDKIDETLAGKYVFVDQFDAYVKWLKTRLRIRKSNPEKISKKEFDRLNTREEWHKWRTGGDEIEQPRRRINKTTGRGVEIIHDTKLFEGLIKRLVIKEQRQHGLADNIRDYCNAIKITDISNITNRGGGRVETQKEFERWKRERHVSLHC